MAYLVSSCMKLLLFALSEMLSIKSYMVDRVVQRWHPKLVLLLVEVIGNMHTELHIMGGISQSNGWRYFFLLRLFMIWMARCDTSIIKWLSVSWSEVKMIDKSIEGCFNFNWSLKCDGCESFVFYVFHNIIL